MKIKISILTVFSLLFLFFVSSCTQAPITESTKTLSEKKLNKEIQKLYDSIPDTPENKDFKEFVKEIKPVSKFNYCNCIPFHAIVEKDGCNFCRQFQAQCYNSKTISGCKDYFDFIEKGVDCIAMNKVNWWHKENSCQIA